MEIELEIETEIEIEMMSLLSHKNNEIFPFSTTEVSLEGIILSETSQTKTNTTWFHLHVESKNKQTNKTNQNRLTGTGQKLLVTKDIMRWAI